MERLPVSVDPIRLAKQRRELSGDLAVKNLKRLQPLLADDQDLVHVHMNFGYDQDEVVVMTLSVETELKLTCQRTLETFAHPVEFDVMLSPIEDEALANRLPEPYEPVLLSEEGMFEPATLIEDELLLHLPDVPKKDAEVGFSYSTGEDEAAAEGKKSNPFDALKTLKDTLD